MDLFMDMAVFCAVAKARSFRKGAESLGMPPSTVSRKVSALEERLGLRLLHRTTRSVRLTTVGQLYYNRCNRLIEEAKLAQEELLGEKADVGGTLRMSLPADFAVRFLAPLIADFVSRHPRVRLEMDLSPRQVDLVSDPFDLAVRVGHLPDSALIRRQVAGLHVGLYAGPGFAERLDINGPKADLSTVPAIALNDQGWEAERQGRSTVLRPDVRFVANNISMLVQLAKSNLGIAKLPTALIKDELVSGELVPVLPSVSLPLLPVHVLTETRLLPARTRLFIEHLAQHLTRAEFAEPSPGTGIGRQ